ncbi:MAG: hypothetical protein ACLP19_27335 [Xanthobacteraceae bacterium]
MKRLPTNMEGRAEKSPGEFKDRANQVGGFVFVAPEDVLGTLIEGFKIYQRLAEPLHRAIFMMFRAT